MLSSEMLIALPVNLKKLIQIKKNHRVSVCVINLKVWKISIKNTALEFYNKINLKAFELKLIITETNSRKMEHNVCSILSSIETSALISICLEW